MNTPIELDSMLGEIFGTDKRISAGRLAWFRTVVLELAPKSYQEYSVNIEDEIAEAKATIKADVLKMFEKALGADEDVDLYETEFAREWVKTRNELRHSVREAFNNLVKDW